ncbi:hypothetical protein NDU88_006754 [Pleurodeles waltl]|uniref:Reverse transcriptase RNase H-like domain-containing protein n=1 Tax=Pleurodeles waltl TaxID=8319 RepID=A0AAV7MGN7_PLEWA|nr:hypothetical protein NDU88_006754 [Pleurodeles waltl]
MDRHGKWLDKLERRISEVEDGQSTMSSGQAKMGKELVALQTEVDDLEARSLRNNLCIVDVAESTAIDNMEGNIECLLIQLLERDTFSSLFAIESAHHSLAGKRQLQDLRLEYRMLYPARLRVMVDCKLFLFTDHKNLAQFLKRRMAGGRGCKTVDTLSQNGCD